MTISKSKSLKVKEYQEVLQLFEKNLKYIESIGIDKSHLQTYRRILNHLNSKNIAEIYEVLDTNLTQKKKKTTLTSQLTDDDLKKLGRDEVKKLLYYEKPTRSTLERMATVRFSVPRGSLSVLRTREALIQKILTLLANEDTHEAISHAALRNQIFDSTDRKDE